MIKGLNDVLLYLNQAIKRDEYHDNHHNNDKHDMFFENLREALSDLACGYIGFNYTYQEKQLHD